MADDVGLLWLQDCAGRLIEYGRVRQIFETPHHELNWSTHDARAVNTTRTSLFSRGVIATVYVSPASAREQRTVVASILHE